MNFTKTLSSVANRLTWPAQRRLASLIYPPGTQASDFLLPAGEPALMGADSVSWRIFRNPVAMFVGGVTAVLLELAEPRVRTGVWEHTTFRERPLERLQRTGYAAMMTVFGPRTRTEAMIRRVSNAHARVEGRTPAGVPYRAQDDILLAWVHATATYGFLQAYATCVEPLPASERDRFYEENQASAHLYGVASPPQSEADVERLFEQMSPHLEPSDIVLEFLRIMQEVRVLPWILKPMQTALIRVAVHGLPGPMRDRLGLDGAEWRLPPWQWPLVRAIGRAGDHLTAPTLPEILARQRLALAPQGSTRC